MIFTASPTSARQFTREQACPVGKSARLSHGLISQCSALDQPHPTNPETGQSHHKTKYDYYPIPNARYGGIGVGAGLGAARGAGEHH